MVGAPSFSQPYLCIQPPLQSPTKILSSISVNFHLYFLHLFFNKIILTIHTNASFPYTAAVFSTSYFCVQPSQQSTSKMFSLPQPFSQFRMRQRMKELWSLWKIFNLSLLLQSMDSDNWARNQWFLIAQAQKIGVLQVLVSAEDACNWNGKPSKPPSLTPSTYCHYFYTLLIPSQEYHHIQLHFLICLNWFSS